MSLETEQIQARWRFKMDYCKERGLPCAEQWAWNEAEEKYKQSLTN